jgi:predicted alpha/beta superfamily hydrolase
VVIKNNISLLLLFFLSCCRLPLIAQDIPGKRDSISSVILKEKRYFQVVLPAGYDPASGNKYDVTYVLDGDWNTKLLSEMEDLLGREGRIPHNIIVGILNTDRDRDFLPTHNKSNRTSGGAEQFLHFLKEELIPYINQRYPSDGENTLFGHSFGGVFVTYALLTEPNVFHSYIAADPSNWWDNDAILKILASKLPGMTVPDRILYVTGRLGAGMKDMRIPEMDSVLKKYAPAGLHWNLTAYPDETHGTVRLKSAYDGLKFSYPDYSSRDIVIHPTNGIFLKGRPIVLWYFGDTANVRYTIDGTEPTRSSPPLKKETLLTEPATVKIRRLTLRPGSDAVFTGHFEAGNYLPAGKLEPHMKPGGFDYAYYEGAWDKLPDFKTLTPVKKGRIDSGFSIDKLPRLVNFALVISGQLKIEEDGYYWFGVDADDGFRFYLDNRLLIDYDGLHSGDAQGSSYILPLKKGFYHVRQEYFQKEGDRKLDLEWLTPGAIASEKSTPIPLNLQYGLSD